MEPPLEPLSTQGPAPPHPGDANEGLRTTPMGQIFGGVVPDAGHYTENGSKKKPGQTLAKHRASVIGY